MPAADVVEGAGDRTTTGAAPLRPRVPQPRLRDLLVGSARLQHRHLGAEPGRAVRALRADRRARCGSAWRPSRSSCRRWCSARWPASIADRFDRRRVLLVTQGLQAVAAAGLWVAWLPVCARPRRSSRCVALSGVFNGLNVPSWQSFVNDLVPRAYLLSAVTLNSVQFHVARAVGPAIAGVLLATLGATWAFLINAVSFVFVLVALRARAGPPAGGGPPSGRGAAPVRQGPALRAGQPGIVAGILVARARRARRQPDLPVHRGLRRRGVRGRTARAGPPQRGARRRRGAGRAAGQRLGQRREPGDDRPVGPARLRASR